MEQFTVRVANENDHEFAKQISEETKRSAIARGSGISERSPQYIIDKMKAGKAIVAVTENNRWAGFSYIQEWANGDYVSNSGLIVEPEFRKMGVAKLIKEATFELARLKFPKAKIFSITTGLAIMKMNARLGFETVTFNELTQDPKFWEGCKSCVKYSILCANEFKNCLCTSMLFDPVKKEEVY